MSRDPVCGPNVTFCFLRWPLVSPCPWHTMATVVIMLGLIVPDHAPGLIHASCLPVTTHGNMRHGDTDSQTLWDMWQVTGEGLPRICLLTMYLAGLTGEHSLPLIGDTFQNMSYRTNHDVGFPTSSYYTQDVSKISKKQTHLNLVTWSDVTKFLNPHKYCYETNPKIMTWGDPTLPTTQWVVNRDGL